MNAIVVVFDSYGALYVQFRDIEVTRTVELIEDALFVDLDEHDNVLGIEALRPGALNSVLSQISETYHLPPSEGQPIDYGGLPGAEALMLIPIGLITAWLIWAWLLLK